MPYYIIMHSNKLLNPLNFLRTADVFVQLSVDPWMLRGATYRYLNTIQCLVILQDLSDLIVISGRLPPENVYYYLSQIKQSGTFSRVSL